MKLLFIYYRLLCRLTYALCLNFLAVIHLDGHVTGAVEKVETSFTKVSCGFIRRQILLKLRCLSEHKWPSTLTWVSFL